jgi:hypothetical protein
VRRPGWIALYVGGLVVVFALFAVATRVRGLVLIPLIIVMLGILLLIRVDQFDQLFGYLDRWSEQLRRWFGRRR